MHGPLYTYERTQLSYGPRLPPQARGPQPLNTPSSPASLPLPLILLLQSTNSHFNRFHLRMWGCGKNSTLSWRRARRKGWKLSSKHLGGAAREKETEECAWIKQRPTLRLICILSRGLKEPGREGRCLTVIFWGNDGHPRSDDFIKSLAKEMIAVRCEYQGQSTGFSTDL